MTTDFHRRGEEPEFKCHGLMERDELNTGSLDLVLKRVDCIIGCDNCTRQNFIPREDRFDGLV